MYFCYIEKEISFTDHMDLLLDYVVFSQLYIQKVCNQEIYYSKKLYYQEQENAIKYNIKSETIKFYIN